MVHLSGAQWAVLLVLSVVWAVIGYTLSERDRRTLGRTPWGLPSPLWAFLRFLSVLLGLILYLIAHGAEIRRSDRSPLSGGPMPGLSSTAGIAPVPGPTVAELFPSYPRPANAPPAAAEPPAAPEPAVGTVPALTPPAPVDWAASPPAWHPDPSGRFHYRWWDGGQWTSHVSTDGHVVVDTSPDQRIGPY